MANRYETTINAISDDSILGRIAFEERPVAIYAHSSYAHVGDKAIGELIRQGVWLEQALRLMRKRGVVIIQSDGIWAVQTTDAQHPQQFDEFEPAFMYALDLMIQGGDNDND